MNFERIKYQRDGHKAIVTLNRPEVLNAIDSRMDAELLDVFSEIRDNPDIWVGIVAGAGDRAFSAGHDMKEPSPAPFDPAPRPPPLGGIYKDTKIWKPMIAAAHGYCLGAGLELAMSCDIRIAADNSQFGIPVARLGILVGYQEMRRLVNLVGPGNASYLLLSGRLIDAHEALRIGLVNRVVPIEEIHEYSYKLAQEMVLLAPLSQKRHKRVLKTVLHNPSLACLTAEEKNLPFTNFDSEDFKEGRQAFFERRNPQFLGR